MSIIIKEKGKKDVVIEPSRRDPKVLEAQIKYKHTVVQDKRKKKPKYKEKFDVDSQ